MQIIGLTGGIGTGKSTVSRILQQSGAHVVDVDGVVHALQKPHHILWDKIVSAFGPQFLTGTHTLNRKMLADYIFGDEAMRQALNEIVWPILWQAVQQQLCDWKRQNVCLAVLDAPLLFEARWDQAVNEIWVVSTSETLQISRVMQRDHLDYAAAQARCRAQMPLADKVARAHVVVENSGSLSELKDRVTDLWENAQKKFCRSEPS
ncbi:MAG: dephospho-CoA kinase [Firmicutes bacterium]|nr:dephospho-CoA kinase [Bacillota bacterium]